MIKGSPQSKLDYFFKTVHAQEVFGGTITKSTLTRVPKKSHHQEFIKLAQNSSAFSIMVFPTGNGKRFVFWLSMDQRLEILGHKDITDHFWAWNPAKGKACPLSRISHLFDAPNRIIVDTILRLKDQRERSMAAAHMQHLRATDLVLLDEGYPVFWLFGMIASWQVHFCGRIKTYWKEIRKFSDSGKKKGGIALLQSFAFVEQYDCLNFPFTPVRLRAMHVELTGGKMKDFFVFLFIWSNVIERLNKLLDLFITAIAPIRPGREY